jgi:hypothetical protein
MPIKKFKPKSPNLNLGKSTGDATFARLADLNKLVEQVNNTSSAPAFPYKTYVAKISQSGTSDPVITVLENTTGWTLTWTRGGAGSYLTQLYQILGNPSKITITCNPGSQPPVGITIFSFVGFSSGYINFNIVSVANYAGAYIGSPGMNDSLLLDATIEIRVYP